MAVRPTARFTCLWDTGLLSVMIPELAAYLDDVGDEGDVAWRRLRAVDRLAAKNQLPNDAILLSVLLQSPAEEYMEGERDPALAFDSFVEEMAARFTVPRRLRERMRVLLSVQKRLRDGKIGNIAKREFFGEAALLHGLDCEARGLPVPAWAFDVTRSTPAHAPEGALRHNENEQRSNGKKPPKRVVRHVG